VPERKASRPVADLADGPRASCSAGRPNNREANFHAPRTQAAPIRATLIGDNRCEAAGITVRGSAPVLALCRKLVEAGHDPAPALEAYRGETLCLRIRSIGEAAGLTVEDSRHGTPRFRRWHGPVQA
jgi:hypothetical protein